MGNLIVPKKYEENSVLIADDERKHIGFLIDFLRARNINVDYARNVGDALALCQEKKYKCYFIDLNIPLGDHVPIIEMSDIYNAYKGLYIIKMVRSQGVPGRNVIAYSAHYNDDIRSEIDLLYCKYLIKGRVREIKDELNSVLFSDNKK